MRALSQRQINTCETGKHPRCRCRCHGALHGIRREGFTQLPMFHIPEEQQHKPRDIWSGVPEVEAMRASG